MEAQTGYSEIASQLTSFKPDPTSDPFTKKKYKKEKDNSTCSGKAVVKSAHFTAEAFSLFHPKYSFTYLGFRDLFSTGGDYNFAPAIGMLELMAAPAQETLRLGAATFGTIGGS